MNPDFRSAAAFWSGEGGVDTMALLALGGAFVAAALAAWTIASELRSRSRRYRESFGREIGSSLRQAFVFIDPARLFRLNVIAIAFAAAAAYGATLRPAMALLAAVLVGSVPTLLIRALMRRRTMRIASQLPDAVLMIAGALRAGAGISQAIAQAGREIGGPVGQELLLLLREQRLGAPIESALAGLERRVALAEVALFCAAIRIAQDTGGNLAETLERLADTLRRKLAVEGKIDSLTAQGRLQGWVMALLPLGVAAALFAIEPAAMRPLVASWQGWLVLGGLVTLELLGLHVIRRIVRIDV